MHDEEPRRAYDESGLEPGGVDLIEQARYSPSAPVWPSIVHSALVALVTRARCGSSVFHRPLVDFAHHDYSEPA
jgi:hypothetical protein